MPLGSYHMFIKYNSESHRHLCTLANLELNLRLVCTAAEHLFQQLHIFDKFFLESRYY